MWHALFQLLADVLSGVWSLFPVVPLAQAETAMGPKAWSTFVQWMGVFGMVIDYQFLVSLIAVMVAWRGFWLAVRIWRTVLELIPMMG